MHPSTSSESKPGPSTEQGEAMATIHDGDREDLEVVAVVDVAEENVDQQGRGSMILIFSKNGRRKQENNRRLKILTPEGTFWGIFRTQKPIFEGHCAHYCYQENEIS